MTPSTQDDTNVPHLLGRFSLPSDGLPVEALDVLVPIIRSHVSKTYMIGWFEKSSPNDQTLAQDLLSWVAFRNKRPAHGVLDKNDVLIWSQRLEMIATRCLQVFATALPKRNPDQTLHTDIGSDTMTINTPLVQKDRAVVISKVTTRKGVWKMHAQSLSWIEAVELTVDLGDNSIFTPSDKPTEKLRLSEIPYYLPATSIFNNIPIRQTNTFVGRSKELGKLQEWMDEIEDSRFCLIYGDGGFGKTTLTLEFFNKLLEGDIERPKHLPTLISYYTAKKTKWTDNGLIHFKGISDAMEDSVRELLHFLYPVLGKDWYQIQGTPLIDKIAGEFAEQGLKRDDILLILDNTETLATSVKEVEELSEFLGKVGKKIGRVIVTSRRREFLPATPLLISSLPDDEAAALMSRLGEEYAAKAVVQAGEARLRNVCKKLSNKPLLIDTLVKYVARSSSSLQEGLDQILRKTNDELLEFLYEDAWLRMNELAREVSGACQCSKSCRWKLRWGCLSRSWNPAYRVPV
ncbi:ATP-binding protein [Undibacterium arcticum]|uniref:ATP-binding protein n=1 Tax=Undibacterium arcticum TaxID=1762892 RepID=UPI0036101CA7